MKTPLCWCLVPSIFESAHVILVDIQNPHINIKTSPIELYHLQELHVTSTNLLGGWPTPLKNMTTRQLGWWHSQYDGKIIIHSCSSHHQPVYRSIKSILRYIKSHWPKLSPILSNHQPLTTLNRFLRWRPEAQHPATHDPRQASSETEPRGCSDPSETSGSRWGSLNFARPGFEISRQSMIMYIYICVYLC